MHKSHLNRRPDMACTIKGLADTEASDQQRRRAEAERDRCCASPVIPTLQLHSSSRGRANTSAAKGYFWDELQLHQLGTHLRLKRGRC